MAERKGPTKLCHGILWHTARGDAESSMLPPEMGVCKSQGWMGNPLCSASSEVQWVSPSNYCLAPRHTCRVSPQSLAAARLLTTLCSPARRSPQPAGLGCIWTIHTHICGGLTQSLYPYIVGTSSHFSLKHESYQHAFI